MLKLRTDKNWFGSCFGWPPAVHIATREEAMECPKCKGLMMLERFSDFFLIFYAWKCINCGAIIDRTISNNRRKSLAARDAQTAQPAQPPVAATR
jgi:ssDNA-binding Zn-finger/Zn-ribbon topoisomerase 1